MMSSGLSDYAPGRHWNGVHWGHDPLNRAGRHHRLGRYDNGERADDRVQMWGKHMGNLGYLRGVSDRSAVYYRPAESPEWERASEAMKTFLKTAFGTMHVTTGVLPPDFFLQPPDQGLSD
jgi:hypothetical protein